ncbi:MAG TPA: aminoacyl-tRNA hydrolase [Candidatus Scatomorpha merdavium]|jgi:PTH1 family peptidyl-tRNA hydrolase|nr:aminoacyl-tRNA hydrolase [Oscillospiraceae bacterium]HIS16423.1 aminoacyl-tRNA hydrolase [Candidatus Scatomorpha merdavium]
MLFEKRGGAEWIFVFLGNPGPRYEGTRHNAGFMVGEVFAKRLGLRINRARWRALTCTAELAGKKVLFMFPQTLMNLSGEAVGPAAKFYKLPPERVLVFSDEMALPPGSVRVRPSGSAGGHNGLKSVIAALGSENFPRIRLGVGEPPHPDYDTADWVLGAPKGKDAELFAQAAERAADAAECYISEGPERAMNKYNRKAQ